MLISVWKAGWFFLFLEANVPFWREQSVAKLNCLAKFGFKKKIARKSSLRIELGLWRHARILKHVWGERIGCGFLCK